MDGDDGTSADMVRKQPGRKRKPDDSALEDVRQTVRLRTDVDSGMHSSENARFAEMLKRQKDQYELIKKTLKVLKLQMDQYKLIENIIRSFQTK